MRCSYLFFAFPLRFSCCYVNAKYNVEISAVCFEPLKVFERLLLLQNLFRLQ
jgi:hypothetical protein